MRRTPNPAPAPAASPSVPPTPSAEEAPRAADARGSAPAAPEVTAPAPDSPPTPSVAHDPAGPRPGDVAREALRAARAQARRSSAETGERADREAERKGPRSRPRPRPGAEPRLPGDRLPGRTADPVAGERARAVRDMLAGAFRMPSDGAAGHETGTETGGGTDGRADTGTVTGGGTDGRTDTGTETGGGTDGRTDTGTRSRTGTDTTDGPPSTSTEASPPATDLYTASRVPGPPGPPEPTAPLPATDAKTRPQTADPRADDLAPAPAPAPVPVSAAAAAAAAASTSAPDTEPSAASPAAGAGAPVRAAEPPRAPRSMAAPSRDGDHRRTFPPFPPRAGGSFAETWWGNAWVTALEEGALDVKRLVRGRGYAEQGNVDAITVTPGLVLAYVQGSRPRPYRVQVRLRTLGGEDWDRFLDAAVERPGHIAALLDKEMPESLADCGVPLLPGPGDLEPQCSCPDRGHPCKHAAALCYQTARLLDADPFVLLLLRGRGEREVLDALSRRNAVRAARAAQEQEQRPEPLTGVRAAEALAERRLPPLPAPLPPPAHPEQPPTYPSAPNGPDSFALDHLATDAAARAHALLTTGRDEIGALTLWQDAVRLAASRPGSGLTAATRALYASLASAAGRTPSELARAVAAWRQGGPDGLTVLQESWDPPAGRFDRARPLLLAADLPAFRPRRNHLTHPRGHVQLRYGQDGLWYAYESEPGRDDWWPRGTPDYDPVGALTGLGGSDDL
ncbi:SWIM zinc finger family protein [Streptomyces sp. NPDC058291]|uniref:SWIM zinc finger family protein n=1 Tax=Streptomyces sp. NPDC058291 TaxID=3346427 RepID=UPI0036E9B937